MICPNCNSDFKHPDSRRRFCSNTCYQTYRINHPKEFGLKEQTYACAYCGKDGIKRKPSQLKNQVFCSRDCSNKFQSDALSETPNLNNADGYAKTCNYCGNTFYVKPHRHKTAKYCSMRCSQSHRRNRTVSAENHPNMMGKHNPNFRDWSAKNSARKEAIHILGHKCAICDFNIVVHVHHIIQASAGGPNTIENLIVLCPNHHEMADRGMIPAEQLIALNPYAVAQQLETQPQSHQQSMFEHSTFDIST